MARWGKYVWDSFIWSKGIVACLAALALALGGCRQNEDRVAPDLRLQGETMGTTYSLIVPGLGADTSVQRAVDSLLAAVNAEVSTYEPQSLISRFNDGDSIRLPVVDGERAGARLHTVPGEHFASNLFLTQAPVQITDGFFDPTVGPLVEYYGFGSKIVDDSEIDLAEVERLRQLVGIAKVRMDTLPDGDQYLLYAAQPGVRLDLSAIAKGYAVDQVGYLLAERFGASSYFVEIGGETRAAGQSPRGDAWTVGINTPDPEASLSDMELVVAITDRAIATSGNYRNVRMRGGKPIVHTLDPHSGLPRSSTLLSATVVADYCSVADAYATACMASAEDAVQVLAKAGLPGCLIFATPSGNYEIRYVGEFTRYVKSVAGQ